MYRLVRKQTNHVLWAGYKVVIERLVTGGVIVGKLAALSDVFQFTSPHYNLRVTSMVAT